MSKHKAILATVLLALAITTIAFFNQNNPPPPPQLPPSPQIETEQTIDFSDTDVLEVAKTWSPPTNWSVSTDSSWNEYNFKRPLSGKVARGSIEGEDFDYHFDFLPANNSLFRKRGWTDSSISASGPGGDIWGYQRLSDTQKQFIIFSWELKAKVEPLTPDGGGVKFVCPCTNELSIFLSDPFPSSWILD